MVSLSTYLCSLFSVSPSHVISFVPDQSSLSLKVNSTIDASLFRYVLAFPKKTLQHSYKRFDLYPTEYLFFPSDCMYKYSRPAKRASRYQYH